MHSPVSIRLEYEYKKIFCFIYKMSNLNENQNKRTRAYVDEVFRQIEEKPDVTDFMILNSKGNAVKTSMEKQKAIQYAGLYEILREKVCAGLQKIDSCDELIMLRLRTSKNETLIVPDGKITVVVTQSSKDRFQNNFFPN